MGSKKYYSYRKKNLEKKWNAAKNSTLNWLSKKEDNIEEDYFLKACKAKNPSKDFFIMVDKLLELENPNIGIIGGKYAEWALSPWMLFPLDKKGDFTVPVRGNLSGVISENDLRLKNGVRENIVLYVELPYQEGRTTLSQMLLNNVAVRTWYQNKPSKKREKETRKKDPKEPESVPSELYAYLCNRAGIS